MKIYDEPEDGLNEKVTEGLRYLHWLKYIKYIESPKYSRLFTFHKKKMKWSLDVVYVELTDKCNLSCLHCYAKNVSGERRELKTENFLNLIDELASLGVLEIVFTGGEPLLYDDIFEVLRYTKSKKIDFSIFTNGTLLNKNTIMKLKALNPQYIAISLDSNKAEIHNKIREKKCFSKVVKNIEFLVSEGIPTRINYTIFKGINDKDVEIEDTISFFIQKKVNRYVVSTVTEYGKGKKNKRFILPTSSGEQIARILQKIATNYQSKSSEREIIPSFSVTTNFENEMNQWENSDALIKNLRTKCGIGTHTCTIKANGDVVLCPVLREEKYCAGNILKRRLKEIWLNSNIFDHFRTHTIEDIPQCNNCPSKKECLGGCKARSLMYNGKFDSPDLWMCSFLKNSNQK